MSACGVAMALALVLGATPVSAASVLTTNYTESQYWIDGTNAGVNGTTVDTPNVTYAIAIGNQTKVYADNGLAFGSNTYTGKALTLTDGKIKYTDEKIPLIDFTNSAIVTDAKVSKNSLAFGQSTASWGDQATAFGNETMASSTNATAFGQSTRATADQATAFGNSTLASGINATASGLETTASGNNSTAVGWKNTASGDSSFAGGEENLASGRSSTVFGRNNEATATNAVAFGGTTFTNKKGEQYQTKNVASGVSSVAFGEGTKATALGTVAFGNGTQAGADDGNGGQDAVAFGGSTKATGGRSVAFGENTVASNTDATAFGNHTTASGIGSTAYGNKSQATGLYATAWGGGDRVTGKDDKGNDIKTGPIASGVYSTAFGSGTQAVAHNAVAWGQESVAGSINDDGTFTVTQADGTQVKALVVNGYGYQVAETWDHKIQTINKDGKDYIILKDQEGQEVYLDENNVVHYRYWNGTEDIKNLQVVQGTYSGSNATAFGYKSQALGTNSLAALGGIVDKDTSNAAAIGNGAEAKLSDSIALGSGAVANRAAQTAGYDPKTKASSTATTDNTWTSTANGIAIGDVTYNADGSVDTSKPVVTRQLTGLAAGTYDTDAVNVAQLKAAVDSVSPHDYSVKSTDPTTDSNYDNTGATGSNALAAGVSATATGENDTAVGKSAHASGGGAIAIGNNVFSGTSVEDIHDDTKYTDVVKIDDNTVGTSRDTVAIGNSSRAAGTSSIALGSNATAGYNNNLQNGNYTTAIGAEAKAFGDHSIAIGYQAGASSQNNQVGGSDNISIGYKASTLKGNNNIAFGNEALVVSTDATNDKAAESGNIAFGYGAKVNHGSNNIALGKGSVTDATVGSSIAIGDSALVDRSVESNGIAIGNGAQVKDKNGGIAIGNGAHVTVANNGEGNPIAIGDGAESGGRQAIALGYQAKTGSQIGQVVIGSTASASAAGVNTTVVGYGATALGAQENLTVLGSGATASTKGSVALGANSVADRWIDENSVYIPTGASDAQKTAIQNTMTGAKDKGGVVSVGKSHSENGQTVIDFTRQITNVAAGSADSDAVNVAQLKAAIASSSSGEGSKTHYYHVNSTVTGAGSNYDNDGAKGTNGMAAGVGAGSTGEDAVAVGSYVVANGIGATAIGNSEGNGNKNQTVYGSTANWATSVGVNNLASGVRGTALGDTNKAAGERSTAVGSSNNAFNENTVAIGTHATAGVENDETHKNAVAIGINTTATGASTIAFGDQANANKTNAIAIGTQAAASIADGVAIGSESKTTVDKGKVGFDVLGEDHSADTSGVWKSTSGAVSVGNASYDRDGNLEVPTDGSIITRQITSVAAGTNDTDAVNVAQLKAVQTHYYSVKDAEGDENLITNPNSNYDNKGATGDRALAAGTYASAKGANSTAVGNHSEANKDRSTAIGSEAKAGTTGDNSTGVNATAIGYLATAKSDNSIAIGGGDNNGHHTEASASMATAIGFNAKAANENSVALGAGSATGDVNTGDEAKKVIKSFNNGTPVYDDEKTYAGLASAENGSVSVGTKDHERQIQNVAAGKISSDSTDAINGSQLYHTAAALAAADKYVTSGSVTTSSSDTSADEVVTLKVKNGDDVTISGLKNNYVTTATTSEDGKTVTLTRNDGTTIPVNLSNILKNDYRLVKNAANTTDGSYAVADDGSITMQVKNEAGQSYDVKLTGVASKATVDQGLNFQGDNTDVTVNRKLGETLGIKGSDYVTTTGDANGSITVDLKQDTKDKINNALSSFDTQIDGTKVKTVDKDHATANFVTGDNISLTNDNGGIKIATVQNPSFTSVTTGDTVINTNGLTITNGPTITKTNVDVHNQQIHNVTAGTSNTDAVNVSQLHTYVSENDKYVTSGEVVSYDESGNATVTLHGANNMPDANVTGIKNNYVTSASTSEDGKTVTLTRNDGGTVDVNLSNILKNDYRLVKNAANTTDGSYAVADDGSITMQVKNEAGQSYDVKLTGVASKATVDQGLNFQGDNTEVTVNRKLGETLGIKGGDDITTTGNANGSITVDLKQDTKDKIDNALQSFDTQIDGNKVKTVNKDSATANFETGKNITLTNDNGAIKIATVESPNFTSVTLGDTTSNDYTTINNAGITINGGPTITKTTINMNNQQITNVASGGDVDNNAANISDVKKAKTEVQAADTSVTVTKNTEPTADGHDIYYVKANLDGLGAMTSFNVAGNGQQTAEIKNGNTVDFKDGKNTTAVTTKKTDGTGVDVTYNLADEITLGEKGANGKDGVDGKIGVNGKDGSAVVINGQDGSIGLNGKDGANGVSIKGDKGTDGTTRVVYETKDGTTIVKHEIATLDDGLKYAGDDGQTDTAKVISKKLNDQLDIVGGADKEKLTEGNIGVNNVDGKLKVQLIKDLTGITSISNGATDASKKTTITLGDNVVNVNNAKITNVTAGTADTDAVNVSQLKDYTAANDKYITGGTVIYDNQGNGTANLTGTNGLTATVTGLTDDYVTTATVATEGDNKNKVTFTRKSGTTFDVDLNGVLAPYSQNDYQLVGNGADETGAYTVDSNGEVTLNVKDKKGNGAAKTVTISGLASQSYVDDKGLTFGANSGTDYTAKLGTKVAVKGSNKQDGHTYSADNVTTEIDDSGNITIKLDDNLKSNSVTVGKDGTNGKDGVDGAIIIKNGKDGKDGADAGIHVIKGADGVDGTNGKDGITRIVYNDGKDGKDGKDHVIATMDDGLKFGANAPAAENGANPVANKLNTTVEVKGAGTKSADNYSGENLYTTVSQDGDGKTTINVLMDKDIKGNSVTVGKDGEPGKDGVDGKIIIKNGKDGKDGADAGIHVIKGADGVDGTNGKDGITRIVYNDGKDGKDGKDHVIATMDDGMKYAGDDAKADGTNVIKKKLNEQLDIVGGADSTKLTDNNIGVNNVDGKLKVQLAGELSSITSISNGGTTIKLGDTTNVVNVGGAKITNVEAGTEDTDAVNVSQLTEVKNLATQHSTVSVGKVKATADDTEVKGGNLALTRSKNTDGSYNYDVKLADEITIGEKGVKGDDGKPGVDGKIGVNGKDGSGVVINGADGSIGLRGKDGEDGKPGTTIVIKGKDGKDGSKGVDGNDVDRVVINDKEVATLDDGMKYSGDTGDQLKMKLNSNVNIKGYATEYSTNNNIAVVSDGTDTLALRLAKHVDLGEDGTIKAGTATMGKQDAGTASADGKNAQTGNYVTGLDNKAWKDNDFVSGRAATEDQLNAVSTSIKTDIASKTFGLTGDDGQSVTKTLDSTIDVVGKKTIGSDGKTEVQNIKTSVADGKLQIELNKDVDLGKDGSIKAGETTINKDGITSNKVTTGNTTMDNSGLTIKSADGDTKKDVSITNNGLNNGGNQIKNVAAGTEDTDAVNVSQLKEVKQVAEAHSTVSVGGQSATENGKSVTGGNLTLTRSENANGGFNYDVKLADDLSIGKAGKDGADGKIGVNGKDGSSVVINGKDGSIGLNGKDGKNGITIKGEAGSAGLDGKDGVTRMVYETKDGDTTVKHEVATLDDGMKYSGDTGDQLKMKLNSNVNIKGGATSYTDTKNIAVVADGKDTLNLRLAKDITGLNSVTTNVVNTNTVNATTVNVGGTTINNEGVTINNGPTITQNKVDVAGNKIENVAPGTKATDAVNVGQLAASNNSLTHSINKLGTRVDRVGANAAALAALHPLDFDPDEKLDFAAGMGNYNGANAAAIGVFYRPNEDTMLSLGGSVGGGENMVNLGVSFKLGQHNHVTTSKVAMAKELLEMKQKMEKLEAQNKYLMDRLGAAPAPKELKNVNFPDVPTDHWAYQYVKSLADRGYLVGYPDGEFKGDRALTRYEYAAIIYRALQNGAPVDDKMADILDEFEPELEHVQKAARFRVDRISGEDNDRHKVERVRVNDEDDKENKVYKDVYGGKIQKAAKSEE